MRTVSSATCVVVFGLSVCACGTASSDEEGTAAVELPAGDVPSAGAMDLSPFAGTWNLVSRDEAGDSVTSLTVVARAEPTGWTIALPGREPVPARVLSADGDSVVLESGPYESAIDPGVQVTTRNVMRVQGDEMTGTYISRRTTRACSR